MVNGLLCRAESVLISCRFSNDIDVVEIRFQSYDPQHRYIAECKNDWWVFNPPLIVKHLPYSTIYLYVNEVPWTGNLSSRWISLPRHELKGEQTMEQHIRNDTYISYVNGVGSLGNKLN